MPLRTGGRFRFRYDLPSSPRFSRWRLKPGFGQIDITLDSAQGLVVDGLFVAQFDHGVASKSSSFAGVIRCLLRPSNELRRAMEMLSRYIDGERKRDQSI